MISEKEIKRFLWRVSWFCAMEEIHRSQSVSGLLTLWRILLGYLLSYLCWWDYVMICIVFLFFFEKARNYHSSTRYKSSSSSVKRVQDRMQRLIFAAGIWSKNIIPEATEAGLDINVYLFTQDSFHFAMAFLQTFPAFSSSLFIAFLISWTSHHHITCRLWLPPHASSTPLSLPHHYFISPWRLPSSLDL